MGQYCQNHKSWNAWPDVLAFVVDIDDGLRADMHWLVLVEGLMDDCLNYILFVLLPDPVFSIAHRRLVLRQRVTAKAKTRQHFIYRNAYISTHGPFTFRWCLAEILFRCQTNDRIYARTKKCSWSFHVPGWPDSLISSEPMIVLYIRLIKHIIKPCPSCSFLEGNWAKARRKCKM